MTTDIRVLRSSAPSMRPRVSDLESGQPMANLESSDPGLYFRLDNGTLMKVGPSHVGTSAPNSSPASGGQTGNSVGETWIDTSNSGLPLLKVYTPSGWLTVSTKGEQGQKGQTGAKGQKGFKGEDSSVVGPKGQKGADGSGGGTGSKGDKGEIGDKGNTGDKGNDGQKGNTGLGEKGQKGEAGSGGNVGGVMNASVIPDTNAAYDLGSAEYKIRHLYLSDNSIYFGDAELPLTVSSDELTFAGTALMPFTLTAVLAALDVQSFIGKAEAVAGGLQIGDIYFNSVENRLTSVTA